jgi:hypothetical protein
MPKKSPTDIAARRQAFINLITTDNGWKLLSFTTTGLAECQHWVLGMGLRAEQPPELVEWLRNEAQPTAALYRKTR